MYSRCGKRLSKIRYKFPLFAPFDVKNIDTNYFRRCIYTLKILLNTTQLIRNCLCSYSMMNLFFSNNNINFVLHTKNKSSVNDE